MIPQRAPARRAQRGVTIVETVIVIVALVVMMIFGLNYAKNLARGSQRQQSTDLEAREMAQIARATKAYITANPTAFALNTNVPITIPQLVTAGLLPTGFANRTGASTPVAISPFGQPYVVVARKLNATDPATAVVAESGSVLPEKLPPVGIVAADSSIYGLKQDIAAQLNKNYQTIAGTVMKGSRTAQGTGGGFTKDLTAWFTGAFADASPVALVNFKDLDPTMPGIDPNDPTNQVRQKKYFGCGYVTQKCTAAGCAVICPYVPGEGQTNGPGIHSYQSSTAYTCGGAVITVLDFGGTLTNGYNEFTYLHGLRMDCPGYVAGDNTTGVCYDTKRSGSVTMNSVVIASDQCSLSTWSAGQPVATAAYGSGVAVCCRWRWEPDYPPAP